MADTSSYTTVRANAILTAEKATGIWAEPCTVITDADTVTVCPDATGAGRQAVTFGTVSGAQMANSAEVLWANLTSSASIVGFALFDAASSGNMIRVVKKDAATSYAAGDQIKINVGGLVVKVKAVLA